MSGCYRRVERQTLPLGSTVRIAQSCHPSPAFISLLMRRVHKHHQPWSCSKSLAVELCNRFVQMSNSSCATASNFEDGILCTQQRSHFSTCLEYVYVKRKNRSLYPDSVRHTYHNIYIHVHMYRHGGPAKSLGLGLAQAHPN